MRHGTNGRKGWPYAMGCLGVILIGFAAIAAALVLLLAVSGSGYSNMHVSDFGTIAERFPGIDESSVVSVDFDYEIWDNGFAPSDYFIVGEIVVDEQTARRWMGEYEWHEASPMDGIGSAGQAEDHVAWLSDEQFDRDVTGKETTGVHETLLFDGNGTVRYEMSTF